MKMIDKIKEYNMAFSTQNTAELETELNFCIKLSLKELFVEFKKCSHDQKKGTDW
jgi:hypothetical protein